MGSPSFISAGDPAWGCHRIIEVASQSPDTDLLGYGSSPFVGDIGMTGISVPGRAVDPQTERYLFRLCGIEIPPGGRIHLRGLRQAIILRSSTAAAGEEVPGNRVTQIQQTNPFWTFPDGNVSWHLRTVHFEEFADRVDPAQLPGWSPTFKGLDTALLYNQVLPYIPLNAGQPPGATVADLGTWHDLRFPWSSADWSLDQPIEGPGALVLYASVRQTDPVNRLLPVTPTDLGAIGQEDRFLLEYPDTAVYGKIAGALTVEMLPCCSEE